MAVNRGVPAGYICFVLLLPVFAVSLTAGLDSPAAAAEQRTLRVAISLDIPPYVMNHAVGGLEVDIMRRALPGHRLQFTQFPYEQLQTAVLNEAADISVGVQAVDSGVNYSVDFITFANYAVSRKADGLNIEGVADLKGHPVLTWEDAYRELGKEFEAQYAPRAAERKNYLEVADQKEQVRKFWEGRGRIIVIDYSIFVYFSRELGHDVNEAALHAIFEPVTNFKAGFKDSGLRDRFNQAIVDMCNDGSYAELMERYGIAVSQSVCK